jgi:hypothetical protein
MTAPYIGALERLKNLPEVFNVNTLSRLMGMPKPTVLAYLTRWKAKAWVEQAGPRSGIYFNLLANPLAASEHRVGALLMAYPSALLMGESVLHAAGWITQIPQQVHVAVEKRRSYVQLTGIALHPRPLDWFKTVAVLQPREAKFNTYGLRSLPPAWALADLRADPLAWHPDADDVDVPDDCQAQVEQASLQLAGMRASEISA